MSLDLNIINILNIFLFAGVIQGLIVSLNLISKKPFQKTHLILGLWLLLFAMANFQIIINSSNLYQLLGQSFTLFLPLTFNLFFGPLIWLFIKKSTDKNFQFTKKQWLHLIPGILEVLYFVIVYCKPLAFRQKFYMTHWNFIEPSLEVLAFVSFATYFIYGILELKKYQQLINTNYADSTIETYEWLKKLLFLLLIFIVVWGILTVVDVFVMKYSLSYLYFYPYYFFVAFIAYFVGLSYKTNEKKKVLVEFEKKSSKALVSSEKQEGIIKALIALMDEQELFLKPDLRSKEVADQLQITVQTFSFVLNKGLQKSFHDYINELRVAHVIKQLNAGELKKKTLLGIAEEAGFNSESSFYRIFKKTTGTTPKKYLSNNS
ncbi:AraC family transcriptional regulator [uncultured Winogradskyella sp.]|uniref:helix-turn-helix domain-containing protein n=1 Tax=uncultured Winogradskyella sp. TaxID=395353 RepID=UPI00260A2C3A|nr:AraC family transcriptional regulator [uncultured Winogradskyella sp.]